MEYAVSMDYGLWGAQHGNIPMAETRLGIQEHRNTFQITDDKVRQ